MGATVEMNDLEPCRVLIELRPMVLAFLTLLQTCFTAWLVQRQYLRDKRRSRRSAERRSGL